MVNKCFIYGLIDPRTRLVRYIGKTFNGMSRPKAHGYKIPLQSKSHSSNWIKELRSCGYDFEIVCLEFVHKDALEEAEIWWIAFGRCLGWPLTNHTPGGERGGHEQTEETKEKIREKMKVRLFTPEHKTRISAAKVGVSKTEVHRQKLREANLGKKASLETRKKISDSNKGRKLNALQQATLDYYRRLKKGPQSEETKAKRSASLRKYHEQRKSNK